MSAVGTQGVALVYMGMRLQGAADERGRENATVGSFRHVAGWFGVNFVGEEYGDWAKIASAGGR